MRCPLCKSTKVKKDGFRRTVTFGEEQQYKCNKCYHNFVDKKARVSR